MRIDLINIVILGICHKFEITLFCTNVVDLYPIILKEFFQAIIFQGTVICIVGHIDNYE